jgi:hypothetical protein
VGLQPSPPITIEKDSFIEDILKRNAEHLENKPDDNKQTNQSTRRLRLARQAENRIDQINSDRKLPPMKDLILILTTIPTLAFVSLIGTILPASAASGVWHIKQSCIGTRHKDTLVQRISCFQSTAMPRKCPLDAPIALEPLWNQLIQRTSVLSLNYVIIKSAAASASLARWIF